MMWGVVVCLGCLAGFMLSGYLSRPFPRAILDVVCGSMLLITDIMPVVTDLVLIVSASYFQPGCLLYWQRLCGYYDSVFRYECYYFALMSLVCLH
jgi:hypothetical protein